MQFFFIVATVTTSICLAIALPTQDPISGERGLRLKPRMECFGAASFYTCNNNKFKGCCSVDPCALANCPDYAFPDFSDPIKHDSLITDGTPHQEIFDGPSTQPECKLGENKMYQPTLYTLLPGNPQVSFHPTPSISLSRDFVNVKSSETQQLLIFPPIPKAAFDCKLGWSQSPSSNATLTGSGLLEVVEVSSLPASLSYGDVMSMTQGSMGTIDLAATPAMGDHEISWDGEQRGCGRMKLFKVAFLSGQMGRVDMVQSEGSGFYIKYHC